MIRGWAIIFLSGSLIDVSKNRFLDLNIYKKSLL